MVINADINPAQLPYKVFKAGRTRLILVCKSFNTGVTFLVIFRIWRVEFASVHFRLPPYRVVHIF
jgi:hypothetical protein